jgi:DNA polymerase-3 subunit beta
VKFRVERDVLAEAVAWTARSLPTRPPVAVLAGLLIEADDRTLTLSGFDYEVSARVEVPADVSSPGRALVSGRLLADICRSLPPTAVEIVLDAGKVVLSCGKARFSLLTLPVDDYPTLPVMPSATGTASTEVFAGAVAQVAIAAGRDDTLPVLTGVRVEIEGDTITLAATDRYRLAVREFPWTPERPDSAAIALIPARTLSDTAKALASATEVTIALSSGPGSEGLVGFESGGRRTTSRLLDGEFPKYRALLPSESSVVATVDTAALIETVRRVALVAERNTPVRLAFRTGEVTLEAGTGDEAQALETLDAALDGDDITIAFNPAYLLDGLGAIAAPVAHLSFTAPTRPAILSGRSDAQDSAPGDYRYLLMPVRLSG